jgi:hypothetical protein
MTAIKPIENDHSADWHRVHFAQFAAAKAIIGEPTPHMRLVMEMSKDVDEQERIWRAGCYLVGYSVLTGEAIWREWSWDRYASAPHEFSAWLRENWPGIHTRRPRRCVRTPETFERSLRGYASWAQGTMGHLDADAPYDQWWDSATSIPFFGRYIAIRLLELFRRYEFLGADLYDIRAVGAHSPIRCLMLLRPDAIPALSTGRAEVVDSVAREAKADLAAVGSDMSFFTFATLLCEYRAGYEDLHDYAGLQHDEELSYTFSRYADHWRGRGFESGLFAARAAVDPHECLGEKQGWTGIRREPPGWMRERGIVWSDLRYDYATSVKVDQPVVRGL